MQDITSWPDFVQALPEVDLPFPGVRGWMIQGNDQQVVFAEFAETIEVPKHTHAEQWEFTLAGKVELRCGEASTEYTAGESFFIPAGTPHAAKVHAGYKAMMIFNAPDRYKLKV